MATKVGDVWYATIADYLTEDFPVVDRWAFNDVTEPRMDVATPVTGVITGQSLNRALYWFRSATGILTPAGNYVNADSLQILSGTGLNTKPGLSPWTQAAILSLFVSPKWESLNRGDPLSLSVAPSTGVISGTPTLRMKYFHVPMASYSTSKTALEAAYRGSLVNGSYDASATWYDDVHAWFTANVDTANRFLWWRPQLSWNNVMPLASTSGSNLQFVAPYEATASPWDIIYVPYGEVLRSGGVSCWVKHVDTNSGEVDYGSDINTRPLVATNSSNPSVAAAWQPVAWTITDNADTNYQKLYYQFLAQRQYNKSGLKNFTLAAFWITDLDGNTVASLSSSFGLAGLAGSTFGLTYLYRHSSSPVSFFRANWTGQWAASAKAPFKVEMFLYGSTFDYTEHTIASIADIRTLAEDSSVPDLVYAGVAEFYPESTVGPALDNVTEPTLQIDVEAPPTIQLKLGAIVQPDGGAP